jgi:hypothetical protein
MCKTISGIDRAWSSSAAASSKSDAVLTLRSAARFAQSSSAPRPKGLSRLRRTLGPLLRPLGKAFVVFRDPQHRILGWGIAHLLGDGARFFRATAPVRGVVDERSRHVSPQAATGMRSPVCPTFQEYSH